MVAVYPNAIKKFNNRVDYTELVEAADVNVAYDEISATQNTLGPNPSWDDIDGVVNKWNTVSNRIRAVREGVSKPYVNVSAHNVSVPFGGNGTIATWTSKTWDTHNIWQGGSQLTCPRSGVYTFDIYMRWHPDNLPLDSQQTPYDRSGQIRISISNINGSANIVNQSGFFPQGFQAGTHMAASITMPWFKGQQAQMLLYQAVMHANPLVGTANCSITYHRDPPTLNNL